MCVGVHACYTRITLIYIISTKCSSLFLSRALRTINFREENEKLNIWVAYFNLENKYGSPPEVIKLVKGLLVFLTLI